MKGIIFVHEIIEYNIPNEKPNRLYLFVEYKKAINLDGNKKRSAGIQRASFALG